VSVTYLEAGDYVVADEDIGTSTPVTVTYGTPADVSLTVDPTRGAPHAELTPRPGSLPFTRLAGGAGTGAASVGLVERFATAEAFAAHLDAQAVPAEARPAVDFGKDLVLAVSVLGGACQGTDVVAVRANIRLTVETRPYDEGCVNKTGPRPLYAYLRVSRSELNIFDSELPTPAPSASSVVE